MLQVFQLTMQIGVTISIFRPPNLYRIRLHYAIHTVMSLIATLKRRGNAPTRRNALSVINVWSVDVQSQRSARTVPLAYYACTSFKVTPWGQSYGYIRSKYASTKFRRVKMPHTPIDRPSVYTVSHRARHDWPNRMH